MVRLTACTRGRSGPPRSVPFSFLPEREAGTRGARTWNPGSGSGSRGSASPSAVRSVGGGGGGRCGLSTAVAAVSSLPLGAAGGGTWRLSTGARGMSGS